METLDSVLKILSFRKLDDITQLLRRARVDFDVSDTYGTLLFSRLTTALIYAPVEDCERLRSLPASDKKELLNALLEIYPPRPYEMEITNVQFYVDPLNVTQTMTSDGIKLFDEPTGWTKVSRCLAEARNRLKEASSEEQFQAVGLLCRETLISLAQTVYNPNLHHSINGIEPSRTDAKRMLEAYLGGELSGDSNEAARRLAKAALDLANSLQHQRTASFRLAALCAEATNSVVNLIAILSGKRDRPGAKLA